MSELIRVSNLTNFQGYMSELIRVSNLTNFQGFSTGSRKPVDNPAALGALSTNR